MVNQQTKKRNKTRLTLTTAKTLLKRGLGVAGTGLVAERWADGMHYSMELGHGGISVEIAPFRSEKKDLFSLYISSGLAGAIRRCYDPETLEEDIEAEDQYQWHVHQENWCEGCCRS